MQNIWSGIPFLGIECGRPIERVHAELIMLIEGNLRVFDRGEVGVLEGVVRLEDVTLADAPSRVIASTPITLQRHQQSIRFRLSVGDDLDTRAQYTLSARLEGEHARTKQPCVFGTVASHPWRPGPPPQDCLIDVHPWNR